MSLACTPLSSVCHSCVLACHPYVTRSYVLVCHPYVTHLYSCVIRKSLVCDLPRILFVTTYRLEISRHKIKFKYTLETMFDKWCLTVISLDFFLKFMLACKLHNIFLPDLLRPNFKFIAFVDLTSFKDPIYQMISWIQVSYWYHMKNFVNSLYESWAMYAWMLKNIKHRCVKTFLLILRL